MDKRFKVIVPDLDYVIGEFSTIEEAEKCLNDCIEWDKKNPQDYTPTYKIERI